MKNMMLFLMALLMSGHMMAQQTIVTGVITDANDGSPLIGANVLVKGAGTGSIANVDGKYSVNVPNGKNVLVFSCVGYRTGDHFKTRTKSAQCDHERGY